MDAFGYLSVLLSIVIGLGITQLLTVVGRLVRRRDSVRWDWLPLVAAATLFLLLVQMWWSMFELRAYRDWTFVRFFVVLLQTVLAYLATALVLPETVDERSDHVSDADESAGIADLRGYYARQAPWLFGVLGATVVVSALKEVALDGTLPTGANLAFHGLYLALSLGAVAIRSRRFHELVGVVNAVAVVVYIGSLFSQLR